MPANNRVRNGVLLGELIDLEMPDCLQEIGRLQDVLKVARADSADLTWRFLGGGQRRDARIRELKQYSDEQLKKLVLEKFDRHNVDISTGDKAVRAFSASSMTTFDWAWGKLLVLEAELRTRVKALEGQLNQAVIDLKNECRQKLLSGEWYATGRPGSRTFKRKRISPDRWISADIKELDDDNATLPDGVVIYDVRFFSTKSNAARSIAERQCAAWLSKLPSDPVRKKKDVYSEALALFPDLTDNAFYRVWKDKAPRKWTEPGFRPKN